MKNQLSFESFYLSNSFPLDSKTVISSLNNLDSEIPLFHRYLGLIFYVTDIKKFYTFKNDVNTAELLINDVNISNTFGIYVDNYSQILTQLNNFSSLGKIIFVFPLNVAFVFNGTNWEYYSGTYNLRTGIDYNNIPNQIKKVGVKVNYENSLKIWNNSLTVSDYILNTNITENKNIFENPLQPIEDRIYLHRLEYYKIIGGKRVNIGHYLKEIPNFTILIGETKIDEILFTDSSDINIPPLLKPVIWVTGYLTVQSPNTEKFPVKLNYKIKTLTDRFEIWVVSDIQYTGTLEIRS